MNLSAARLRSAILESALTDRMVAIRGTEADADLLCAASLSGGDRGDGTHEYSGPDWRVRITVRTAR
jgi:hypothetical protein